MTKTVLILAGLGLLTLGAVQAQQGFSSIEERMTGKEFTLAGLDKLSNEELAALNEWLRSHSVATMENRNQEYSDTRGFENQALRDLDDDDVVSGIQGEFKGWKDYTTFTLENGMVWKQAESDTWNVSATTDAVAIIEKGSFNSWRLRIQGYNRSVLVNRVE